MSDWPILKSYTGESLARIAMPVGGIGTGTVSLCGIGAWRHWEVANRPAKGFTPIGQGRAAPFFALRAAKVGAAAVTRLLEGPLPLHEWEGEEGSLSPNAGLPRFRECAFHAAYPLARVDLADADVPLRVAMEVFNPLIPGDSDRSGLPVAMVRLRLRNPTRSPVRASVAVALPNFIGSDGFAQSLDAFRGRLVPTGTSGGVNSFRDQDRLRGVFLESRGVAARHPAQGTLAIATTARRGVTHRTSWVGQGWSDALLDFWDDFSDDGKLEPRTEASDTPTASLAVALSLPPGEERDVKFILAWHFPHRLAWGRQRGRKPAIVGNYYTEQFPDAWAAAAHAARGWDCLESQTVSFVRSVVASSLPAEVREAALFNLSTLRSQTCFRTRDGRFFGWEGSFDRQGSCHGNCTHVWNYEHATANLFPDLARSMRETEFSDHSMQADGLMAFRVALPLKAGTSQPFAAADGQMGCLVKLHREWRLSGDTAWLRRLWPHAKRALAFAWLPGSWDADQDGVMEGCQHNTMDVEYFGPNPQMASWYLGALRAMEAMAAALGDLDFAAHCRDLHQRGRTWVDTNLFNGEYYEHHIKPAKSWADVRPGLAVGSGAKDPAHPEFQLGAGCLIDQLAGQVNAHFERLGHILKPVHQRTALQAVLTHNRRRHFHGHFNPMRSYALGDDSAVLMASYPRGRRPAKPFPYSTEVMTGFEYCLAIHLLQEGRTRDGLHVVRDIRNRYDGRKRNPFDEAECGHHYARAMASWGLIDAYTGFHYSALTRTLTLSATTHAVQWPWAVGGASGTIELRPQRKTVRITLAVTTGKLPLARLALTGIGEIFLSRTKTLAAGRLHRFVINLPS